MITLLLSLSACALAIFALLVATSPRSIDPAFEALMAKEISRQLKVRASLGLAAQTRRITQ